MALIGGLPGKGGYNTKASTCVEALNFSQLHEKLRAFTLAFGFYPDLAAVGGDDAFGDIKSEAGFLS